MKKFVNLTLFTMASLFHVEAKDIGNRIFLPYLDSRLVVSFVNSKAQQIKPVTYTPNIFTTTLNAEFLCQEATYNISSAGGGLSVGATLKINPIIKLTKFNIHTNGGFAYSILANISTKTTLQDEYYV